MFTVKGTLTIIFDPPFYKAIFERRAGSIYEVSQVNLGTSEPKSSLIYNLINKHWSKVHYFRQNVINNLFLKSELTLKVYNV